MIRASAAAATLLALAASVASLSMGAATDSVGTAVRPEPPRVFRVNVSVSGAGFVTLRAPDGKRVAVRGDFVTIAQVSGVRATVTRGHDGQEDEPGPSHVEFDIQETAPGAWRVETESGIETSVAVSVQAQAKGAAACAAGDTAELKPHGTQAWQVAWSARADSDSCTVDIVRVAPLKPRSTAGRKTQ